MPDILGAVLAPTHSRAKSLKNREKSVHQGPSALEGFVPLSLCAGFERGCSGAERHCVNRCLVG